MAEKLLYHMLPVASWEAFKQSGEPYFPPTYEQDGFVHLTEDPALLLSVANHFYTDAKGDWAVLKLDAAKLTAEVKFEGAAPVGNKETKNFGSGGEAASVESGPLFPHLYGGINLAAVAGPPLPMQRDAEGRFLGIDAHVK